ncbi:MAG: hypothetical protein AAGH19_12825, partial [Pseudomonadota bacterium]
MTRFPAPFRPHTLTLAVALALGTSSALAQDTPSLEEMWEMIQAQQEQIEALQEQNAELLEQVEAAQARDEAEAAAEAAAEVAAEEAYADVVMEGEAMKEPAMITPVPEPEADGEWNLNIYGHAMLDMGYQTNQNDPD